MGRKNNNESMGSQDQERDPGLLKNVRDITFLVAIFLYFSGWIYVYSYYDYFGLSIHNLDEELYYFFIYSVNVIIYWWNAHWLLFIIALLVSTLLGWQLSKKPILFYTVFLSALLIFTYLTSYYAGIGMAMQQRVSAQSTLIPIRFVFSEKFEPVGTVKPLDELSHIQEDFMQANRDTSLLLLAVGKEEYYVFIEDDSLTERNEQNSPIQIYTIKKESVKLATTLKP